MSSNGNGIANGKTVPLWKLLEILILCLLAVNTGLTGWTLNKVVSLSEKVAAIEANQFDASDGLEVWRELANKANTKDVPAPEVLRRLDTLERRYGDLVSSK